MTARQRRLYETAFDSRTKRDDLDCLVPSPELFRAAEVSRAASRSSFGSTSGSSASSTPTHAPPSRRPFTPTERRKAGLLRDLHAPRGQSLSELNRRIVNASYERKLSSWDSVSRSSSDQSSSQESMNVVDSKEELRLNCRNERRNCNLGKSSSRDDLLFADEHRNPTANYPSNWKELSNARLENSNDFQKTVQDIVLQKEDVQEDKTTFIVKKPIAHSGVKQQVLPTDNSRFLKPKKLSDSSQDSKENNSENLCPGVEVRRRPCSLLAEVRRPLDNVPQSPDNDQRPSEEYDAPWEFQTGVLRPSVNGSVSVPERLSQPACNPLPTSVTHDNLDVEEPKEPVVNKPARPTGLSRPNLNLNLNLNSDSPRKARQSLTLNFGCAALCAVGEKVDAELTLEKQGWYHGSISRLDAENLLRVLKEGSYLVRNSESSKQDYSLSLRSARGFMHMKIVHSEGRFILGQFSNPFASIPEMIHHYSTHKLPIKGAEHMSLLYPVIDQLL